RGDFIDSFVGNGRGVIPDGLAPLTPVNAVLPARFNAGDVVLSELAKGRHPSGFFGLAFGGGFLRERVPALSDGLASLARQFARRVQIAGRGTPEPEFAAAPTGVGGKEPTGDLAGTNAQVEAVPVRNDPRLV